MSKWWIKSDNYVTLSDLTDVKTGSKITSGTITMTLYDSEDSPVSGAVAIALSHISDGDWDGTIPDTITLVDGDEYYLLITVDASSDVTLKIDRLAGYYEGT